MSCTLTENSLQSDKLAASAANLDPNRLVDDIEASDFIGTKKQTLRSWRCSGRYSLPFIKVGRNVRYRVGDLLAFIESRRVTSTTQGNQLD